jgi:selT/selW/selH-like putative selenoprotein
LAKAIEDEFEISPQLIKSGGGVFEVEADDTLIFSKKKEFRFPSNEEMITQLKSL